jgi:hypothetical protein
VTRHDGPVASTQEQRSRPDPVVAARTVVAERYPEAVQAWLSGSVVLGGSTSTSDLDITVLRDAGEARRESLTFQGWPVEMFIHTSDTIRWFVGKDLARRKPTMARLVATGIPLLPGTAGEELRQACAEVLGVGPGPVPDAEMDLMRYHLTDQVDDLATIDPGPVGDAIAVEVWRLTAELLLASHAAWTGGAKWLIREIGTLDTQLGTDFATRLHAGLSAALGVTRCHCRASRRRHWPTSEDACGPAFRWLQPMLRHPRTDRPERTHMPLSALGAADERTRRVSPDLDFGCDSRPDSGTC